MILSQYKQEPHPLGGEAISPTVILLHYTATRSRPRLPMPAPLHRIRWHFTVDLDGTVYQHLDTHRRGAHAGDSEWRGRSALNDFAVGIELVNPGPVWLRDGVLRDIHGKIWARTGSVVAKHDKPGCQWTRWAEYTREQVDATGRLCAELVHGEPALREILGHSDVSQSGKVDPGPAFPINWLRATVYPGCAQI